MNTQDSKSSSRRRGPRRRRPEDQGDYRHTPKSQHRQEPSPPHKPTFFQKILSFFGFGPKKKTYPAYQGGAKQDGVKTPKVGNNTSNRFEDAPRGNSQSEPRASAPSRPARKPEAVEVNSPKLYVGNLSFDATESDLTELFSGVGAVRNVEIVTYRDTEKSKGFGFIMMTAVDEAKRAVAELHDKEFMGRRLVVSGAKTNDRAA